jgi:Spy/CpxP family protein refolding chaperone
MLRGVDLTDAQRQQILAIHESVRDETLAGKMGDLQKQLQLAILSDAQDLQKIEQLKQAIAEAEAVMLAHRIDVQTRVVQLLTPAQRAQARQNLEKVSQPGGRLGRGQWPDPWPGGRR